MFGRGETFYSVVFSLYIERHMVFYEVPRHTDQSDCTEKKRKSTYPSSRTVRNKHVSYNQRGLNFCSNQDDSVTFVSVTTTVSNVVHRTSGIAHRSYCSSNYKARGLGRPSGCHLRVIQLIDLTLGGCIAEGPLTTIKEFGAPPSGF